MMVTLSDEEYAALTAEAAKSGKPIDTILHEALAQRVPVPAKPAMSGREFMELQYREGKLLNLPTRAATASLDATERERLAQKLAAGQPLSEIVIEDRGKTDGNRLYC